VQRTFNAPALTYEVGDETNRELIKRVAATAAEEFMKILIENSNINYSEMTKKIGADVNQNACNVIKYLFLTIKGDLIRSPIQIINTCKFVLF